MLSLEERFQAKRLAEKIKRDEVKQRAHSSSSTSTSTSNSTSNPNTIKVYSVDLRSDASNVSSDHQFMGETCWDDIYQKVYENVDPEIDEAASEMSDEELHRKDNANQEDNEDWDDQESDDRSYSTSFSNISKASRSSHTSNLSSKSDASRMTVTTQGSQRRKKHSDEEMKIAAYAITFCELSKPCKCEKSCCDNLKFAQVCTCIML